MERVLKLFMYYKMLSLQSIESLQELVILATHWYVLIAHPYRHMMKGR